MRKTIFYYLGALLITMGLLSCSESELEVEINEDIPSVITRNPVKKNYTGVPISPGPNGAGGVWVWDRERWEWVEEVDGWDGQYEEPYKPENPEYEDDDPFKPDPDPSAGGVMHGGPVKDPRDGIIVSRGRIWSWEFDIDKIPNKIYFDIDSYEQIAFKCFILSGDIEYRYSRDGIKLLLVYSPNTGTYEYLDWDGDENYYEFHYDFWGSGKYGVKFKMPNEYRGEGRVRLVIESLDY